MNPSLCLSAADAQSLRVILDQKEMDADDVATMKSILDRATNAQAPDQDEDADEVRRQRDLLLSEIADAALKAGIYNGEAPLNGPQCLMLLEDMATVIALQDSRKELEDKLLLDAQKTKADCDRLMVALVPFSQAPIDEACPDTRPLSGSWPDQTSPSYGHVRKARKLIHELLAPHGPDDRPQTLNTSEPMLELPLPEARKICARLEFDSSWDKCGDGYYRLKRRIMEFEAASTPNDQTATAD